MVEKYVEAINNGAVPAINSAWEHLVETECREAIEVCWNLHEEAIKKFLSEEDAKGMDDLYHIVKNIRDKTLEKFNLLTASFDRHETVAEYKEKLKVHLDLREDAVFIRNEALALTQNEDLLNKLSKTIKDKLSKG